MKIKYPKEVTNFIKQFTCIASKEGKSYYYVPYWFEDNKDGTVTMHSLDHLPDNIKHLISDLRGEPKPTITSLDTEDIMALLKGTPPNYHVQDSPVVRHFGKMVNESWQWDIIALGQCGNEFLWSLYVICKESWKKKP